MIHLYDIIRRPIITESTSYAEEKYNKYTFEVNTRSNKLDIKKAVEEIFKVKVSCVNVLNRKGKVKKTKNNIGRRRDAKRAIVTLLKDSPLIDITGKLG